MNMGQMPGGRRGGLRLWVLPFCLELKQLLLPQCAQSKQILQFLN